MVGALPEGIKVPGGCIVHEALPLHLRMHREAQNARHLHPVQSAVTRGPGKKKGIGSTGEGKCLLVPRAAVKMSAHQHSVKPILRPSCDVDTVDAAVVLHAEQTASIGVERPPNP